MEKSNKKTLEISVVIVCYNEENHIDDCLKSLLNQVYDRTHYEIIIIDGDSTDNTKEKILPYVQEYSFIRMIIEKKRGTAVARNRGINEARYDFVAFIDADCEAPPDWLNILSEKYLKSVKNDHHIIGVGGKNIPPQNADNFVKAIGIALDNYIGSFNSSHGRQFPEERYILSPSNLNVLYQKQPLIDIGGYDETLKSEAEDADINYRLTIEGYRFMYIPESYVWHKMRPTPSSWFKNMFRYGKGRARLLKRHRGMWQISFVLPIIFLFAFSGLIFIPLSKIFCVCLLYFPIVVVISLRQVLLKKVPQLWIHTICVYIIQHFGYAMGECFGLISPRVR